MSKVNQQKGLTKHQVEIIKEMMFVYLRAKHKAVNHKAHKDIVAHMEYLLDDYVEKV